MSSEKVWHPYLSTWESTTASVKVTNLFEQTSTRVTQAVVVSWPHLLMAPLPVLRSAVSNSLHTMSCCFYEEIYIHPSTTASALHLGLSLGLRLPHYTTSSVSSWRDHRERAVYKADRETSAHNGYDLSSQDFSLHGLRTRPPTVNRVCWPRTKHHQPGVLRWESCQELRGQIIEDQTRYPP
jgi:hypothetical protein